ncbi:MAG TPA: glycosyltransferase family 2 protein [Polyangiaceae bacterium]|nr:glycosyltransferase family 2 protein [Polyangiaceae bacterium]
MTVVSAVVCTRNRPEPVARVVRSLLRSPNADLELLVVDQSDGPETENALGPLLSDARLRYCRSKARGKGAALNEGIRAARGEIVVCTDDDCEAPPDWVDEMANALKSQPSAVVAFCSVVPVPHDERAGYVPAYQLKKNRLLRSVSAICGGLGIGAGMALRRDFALSMGGFDEAFGPGARFPSADEWDIAMRALLTGHHVFETAETEIVHDGFRTFQEGRAHARRDWVALGAVCAKPLRAMHLRAAIVPLWLFSTRAVWPPIEDALHLRKPRGLIRIVAFVEGFGKGLRTAVDPATLRFT